jgi:hypothetical protein
MQLYLSGRRRLAGMLVALGVVSASAAVGPRLVRAFTLVPNIIAFDPLTVPARHSLHVHFVNRFGAANMDVRFSVAPTNVPGSTPLFFGPFTLAPGEGMEQVVSSASLPPPPPGAGVPVVVSILVNDTNSAQRLPVDWSGTVASSVELTNDKTGLPILILGSRHIVQDGTGSPRFCLSCN